MCSLFRYYDCCKVIVCIAILSICSYLRNYTCLCYAFFTLFISLCAHYGYNVFHSLVYCWNQYNYTNCTGVNCRKIYPHNLQLLLTVGIKHSQCPIALGSFFFVDLNRDQWRFMTSLTGGEMRNNCINKNFYSRPYKCGVLPHLTQLSFATLLFISAAIEASNLKFVLNLCSESSMPKTTFRTKFGRGLSQRSIAKIVGPPTYFYNRWT